MTRKTAFFERWSWFRFNNLGLALDTNLKFCTSVAKRLKLKVRTFWGPNPTFVEVTGEKLIGGGLFGPPILNRVNIMFFYVFVCNIIKVNHFVYGFIILLQLISSFSLTRSLLVPYANVSVESIDCILLSWFEPKAIFFISSVETLCLSLLNLYYVF